MSKPKFSTHGKEWTMFSPTQSMYETVSQIYNVGLFFSLLKKHRLDLLLQGDDDYTVFMISDEFFLKLSPDEMDVFLKVPGVLDQILRNHFVKGRYDIDVLQPFQTKEMQTIQGSVLVVKNDNRRLFINDFVKLYDKNIQCNNGLINIVDKPIMPVDIFL